MMNLRGRTDGRLRLRPRARVVPTTYFGVTSHPSSSIFNTPLPLYISPIWDEGVGWMPLIAARRCALTFLFLALSPWMRLIDCLICFPRARPRRSSTYTATRGLPTEWSFDSFRTVSSPWTRLVNPIQSLYLSPPYAISQPILLLAPSADGRASGPSLEYHIALHLPVAALSHWVLLYPHLHPPASPRSIMSFLSLSVCMLLSDILIHPLFEGADVCP